MIKKFPSFLIFQFSLAFSPISNANLLYCFNIKLKDLHSNTNVILICFSSRPSINILKLNIYFVDLTLP